MTEDGRNEIEVVQAVATYIIEVTNIDAIDNDFAAVRFETATLQTRNPFPSIPEEGILVGMNLPTLRLLHDELGLLLRSLEDRLGKRLP